MKLKQQPYTNMSFSSLATSALRFSQLVQAPSGPEAGVWARWMTSDGCHLMTSLRFVVSVCSSRAANGEVLGPEKHRLRSLGSYVRGEES